MTDVMLDDESFHSDLLGPFRLKRSSSGQATGDLDLVRLPSETLRERRGERSATLARRATYSNPMARALAENCRAARAAVMGRATRNGAPRHDFWAPVTASTPTTLFSARGWGCPPLSATSIP
jgi:hypothetical protein